MKKILITGGAGFIGFHLANKLSGDKNNQLLLIDNLSKGKWDEDFKNLLKKTNIRFTQADLTNPSTYAGLEKGFDEVYHLAAILGVKKVIDNPHECLRVNTLSTLLLLDWLITGGGKKIVFSSTSEIFAWSKNIPIPTPEEIPLTLTDLKDPRCSYAESKIWGELGVTHYCQSKKIPFAIIRYFNIYGPRMGNDHVIPELYARARKGQNPLIVYSAHHTRSFCYVSDAVDLTISAMEKTQTTGDTFNIGNDTEEISIGELAKNLLETAQIKIELTPAKAENDPVLRRCPDMTKTKKVLNFIPLVSLSQGLKITLDWYSKNLFTL